MGFDFEISKVAAKICSNDVNLAVDMICNNVIEINRKSKINYNNINGWICQSCSFLNAQFYTCCMLCREYK